MFPDLERLCSLTDVQWGREGSDWNAFFDPIGLMLRLPPVNGGYWCTPMNSLSFATTGGDGTHGSLGRLRRSVSERNVRSSRGRSGANDSLFTPGHL